MINLIPSLLVLAVLTGCSSYGDSRVADGGAVYEWTKTDPQSGLICEARVISSRETDGGNINIDGQDCSLGAEAKKLQAPDINLDMLNLMLDRAFPVMEGGR